MNKKGSTFVNLVIFGLAFIIFIFAAPMLYAIITAGMAGQGTATTFLMKIFLWTILIVFIAVFLRIISSGEGFFA